MTAPSTKIGMTRTPRARAASISSRTMSSGIIQPPTAPLVGRGQPVRADDRQQHLAGRHRADDFLGEVHARLDSVHIDEDLALAETIGQAVIQPASKMAGFLCRR